MGNQKTKTRKKRSSKKRQEQYFVSNFLKQPGKTRSGIRYSRKRKGESSSESIFGSLMNSSVRKKQPKGLETAKERCSCQQCRNKRRKEEARTCTSKHSGMSILLKSDTALNLPTHQAQGKLKESAGCSLPQGQSKQVDANDYCKCRECMDGSNSSVGEEVFESMLQQSIRSIANNDYMGKTTACTSSTDGLVHSSLNNLKRTKPDEESVCGCSECAAPNQSASPNFTKQPKNSKEKVGKNGKAGKRKVKFRRKRHPLESSVPRAKKSKRMIQGNLKGKAKSKIRKRKSKKSKSLLHFVLKKKPTASDLTESANLPIASCSCCKRFQEMIQAIHYNRSAHRMTKSQENVLCQWQPCESSKCMTKVPKLSAGPMLDPSAGPVRKSSFKQKKPNVFPSSRKNKPELTKTQQTPSQKKCVSTKAKNTSSKTYKCKKRKVKVASKPKKGKWVLLTDRVIQALRNKARRVEKAIQKQSYEKDATSSKHKKKSVAPSPSIGKNGKKRKSKKVKKIRSFPTRKSSKFSVNETTISAPIPSGRIPTFIAMVKTAIRDLRPFNMTSAVAISKYIELRYKFKNDELLDYVLKWMIKMRVAKLRDGNYYFAGKKLVEKKTVAVLRVKKRKRKSKRRYKSKGMYYSRPAKKYGKLRQKRQRKKKKRKKKRKRKSKKKCSDKCTCAQELNAKKNRVKLRTKYIRKRGRIYKQEEYI